MKLTQRYLDGTYLEDNPTFHVEDSPWKAQQIAKMLARHQLTPDSICEIGCGAGEILRQLQLLYPATTSLHGYEISPDGYALALTRQNERLRFFNTDLLAGQETHYDLALCIDVFEHVEDFFGFLRKLRSVADRFIFHIPLDMNVQMVLRGEPIRRVRQQVGHLHYFSKDTALAALEETGYYVEDWFYTPTANERGAHFRSRIAKAPRQLLSRLSQEMAVRILGGYSLLVYASGEKYRGT